LIDSDTDSDPDYEKMVLCWLRVVRRTSPESRCWRKWEARHEKPIGVGIWIGIGIEKITGNRE